MGRRLHGSFAKYNAAGTIAPVTQWESTVAAQKAGNKHLAGGVSESEFVRLREERDATLALPQRILHALQVNLRGGRLPDPEADGHCYLKIPVDRL